ncbi:MAG: T9SS type A sorting domain-containing protein [Bacteroidales bacterium]|nr:T9SS type A sorting domain-containing protein [Bacteroidales bacterium]
MKKIAITFLCIVLFTYAFGQIVDLGTTVQHADISVADIDMDSDIDIVLAGHDGSAKYTAVLINDGEGNFTAEETPFPEAVSHTTLAWTDMDGDGDPDLLESGWALANAFAGIYINDGSGSFTASDLELPQIAPGCGWADLNNDALLDILVMGNGDGVSAIFMNNGDGTYEESAFTGYNWIDPEPTLIDFDGDMDLDMFINAWDETNLTRFSRLFVNDGGDFTETDPDIYDKSYGSAEWGDIDADGDLDLLLNGDGHAATGEESSDIYRLYRNNEGTLTEFATFETYRQISVGDGSRIIDWDNDGDLDIILTGWSVNLERQATNIFLNTGTGTFNPHPTALNDIPGVSESSIEVADVDGDNKIDLLITGYCGDQGAPNTYNRNVNLIYMNNSETANTAPSAPTNLNVTVEESTGKVDFSWDAGSDEETPTASLNYNFYVMDNLGVYLISPNANISTGKSYVDAKGNAGLNTSWYLYLPEGTYTWGVQTIDGGRMESGFAEGDEFNVEPVSVNTENLGSIRIFPNPILNNKLIIESDQPLKEVRITDISGAELKRFIYPENEIILNIKPGFYIIKVVTETYESYTNKIIVQD